MLVSLVFFTLRYKNNSNNQCNCTQNSYKGVHTLLHENLRTYTYMYIFKISIEVEKASGGEVGGWGRVPFSRNFMSPTPRRKWYLMTGRRFHLMVLDPIPQSLPVHFFGSRPQPPTSPQHVPKGGARFVRHAEHWYLHNISEL